MSGIECADLQDSAKENVGTQGHQPPGPRVFPPFPGKLFVDNKLDLREKDFKIKINNFVTSKRITRLRQLTAKSHFPTPGVLAHFASKAYEDYKTGETDADYEERLELPEGWKLLTTASNSSTFNRYFGAAYWHPENQQVVIAHRGTEPTNKGALWTDFNGVLRNKYVQQMNSASTFANKVVEVLREVKCIKGVSFQLFFTGHSLGGWLAQITTFTTKYLKTEGNNFVLKCDEEAQSFHPHTVVFDSPGCKDMLSKMTDNHDVRLHGRSIDIEHLDITSYLSAPNRINTCNRHIGTVYRIFPDLSDMSWWQKNTVVKYDFATHNIEKIVKAFDSLTGQIPKDERDQLKVQVVVDWPISDGLRGGEEYTNFFKWAKHYNDYHPDITDKIFHLEHYLTIRYQTKAYDEGVSKMNVFCQQERLFLESYRWLRQLPELFKHKNIFNLEKEAQDKAEKILENFEIKNDNIRCTDGETLQTLISYVKRLFQLFPKITENAVLPDDTTKTVYQLETKRYIKRINESPLKFESDALWLTDFEVSEQQQVLHLQMFDGDEWTGLIRVYSLLQKTDCFSKDQYIILTLKRFVTVNQFVGISKLMKSIVTPYRLLIACEENQPLDEKTKDTIRTLFDTIKQKPNIKVIFTTRIEDSTVDFLQHIGRDMFQKGFVRTDEQLTWSDLTIRSQENLLEKRVKFQGAKISLNEIMSAECPAAKFLSLGALLEEKVTIADPVPIANVYNGRYYIGRVFRHQEDIKEDIDTDSSHTYTTDGLVKLLEQAQHQRVMLISDTAGMGKSTVLTHLSKQIKEKFPTKWVVRIDLNDHTDALKALEKEQMDEEKAIEFVSKKLLKLEHDFELELFKQGCEQDQKLRTVVRIVIMLDGFDEISPVYQKTAIDLLLALRKTAVEQLWVTTRPHLREDLENKLKPMSYTLEPFSEKDQIEFLTKFWSLEDWFTDAENKDKKTKEKLEIYAEHLVKKMATSIGDKDRKLTGIPLQTLMLAEAFNKEVQSFYQSDEPSPELQSKLELCGLYGGFIERKYDIYQKEKLQARVNNVIAIEQRKRDLKIMGEDHQQLALEVLITKEQVAPFQNNRKISFPIEELTRLGIAQKNVEPPFIHHTFADYYVADCLVNSLTEWNSTSQQAQDFLLKYIFKKEDYQVVRNFIEGLLPMSQSSNEVLRQYGKSITELEEDGVHILHQVVREGNANIIGFLLACVQAGRHTETVIRLLLGQDKYGRTAWHLAALAGNVQVLEKLWNCANKTLIREELCKILLLATDIMGKNAWHVAAKVGNLQVLEKLWECAEQNLTREERGNNFLLATDHKGRTVYHMAAMMGKVDLLQRLWKMAEGNLKEKYGELLLATDHEGMTTWHVAAKWGNLQGLMEIWKWAENNVEEDEINNKLLLATDKKGNTALHMAAKDGELEVLKKIYEWAKDKVSGKEIGNKLLAGDIEGKTVWCAAADMGALELLQTIWEWSKKNLTREEISNKLFFATYNKGKTAWHFPAYKVYLDPFQTVWKIVKEEVTRKEIIIEYILAIYHRKMTILHVAVELGNLELLQDIWEWAKGNLKTEDLNNKLLLATDSMKMTVCHMAARGGNLEIWLKILEWANEKLEAEEIKNKLLLATDSKGNTSWHLAAQGGKLEVLQKIWEWANEKLKEEEMRNNLLLATDSKGNTSWHLAAQGGKLEVLQKIWEWANEKLKEEEIKNKLLLATDNRGRTVWHLAARWSNLDLLQKLWEWTKEKITAGDKSKLLLAKDSYGLTALHLAAGYSNLDLLKKIFEWAKEKPTTENMHKNLLLATDGMGMTAWHVAVKECKLDILQKLWEWAKVILESHEVYNKLLLAKDNRGRTVCHLAARWNNLKLLQQLWELAEEKLTEEGMSNELLLTKENTLLFTTDNRGRTVCHLAARSNNLELLQQLWEWAKELTEDVINNKLLLTKDSRGMTAWHVAALFGNQKLLEKLWELAKERLKTEEVNNILLLDTDDLGWTVTHIAAKHRNLHILQQLWEWAKENTLLLATGDVEQSVSHTEANGDEIRLQLLELEEMKSAVEEINKFVLI